MKNFAFGIIIIIITLGFANCGAHSQVTTSAGAASSADSLKKESMSLPVIDIKPLVIQVKKSEGRFITREVRVLNRGGSDLKIDEVIASCKCSSAMVMTGTVEPMTIGKIRLSVNQDGVEDNNNIIEFVVRSNAKNSPTVIKIELVD